MSKTVELAKELISIESVTPHDSGCQLLLAERLKKIGFTIEHHNFKDVSNMYAYRGTGEPVFVFAGHTDVVPPGPLEQWTSPPFQPQIRDDVLYGRGTADMKAAIAAMVTACERFLEKQTNYDGTIAFLITSDEEGPAIDGTTRVVQHLKDNNKNIDWCLVGESSSRKTFGDTIKIGRRGSLSAKLKIKGIQGHIAYPQNAKNPIHIALPFLQELTNTTWDNGNEAFQPTNLQVSNIHAGVGATNVTPGDIETLFNFRYCPDTTSDELMKRVENLLSQHQLEYQIDWQLSAKPFLSTTGKLVNSTLQAIEKHANVKSAISTDGGTSDGRFIAEICDEVIEFGPLNDSIHKVNEHVLVKDLDLLSTIYQDILEGLFSCG